MTRFIKKFERRRIDMFEIIRRHLAALPQRAQFLVIIKAAENLFIRHLACGRARRGIENDYVHAHLLGFLREHFAKLAAADNAEARERIFLTAKFERIVHEVLSNEM